MRVSLNRRIWRHAQRTSVARGRTVPVYTPDIAAQLSTLSITRGGHGSPLLQQIAHRSIRNGPAAFAQSPLQVRLMHSVIDDDGDSMSYFERVEPTELLDSEMHYIEMLERAYKGEKNWHIAKDVFKEIQAANGEGLTVNVATALVEVFAARSRPIECLETLRYARDHGVRPRIHAYSSTIACCYKDAKYAQALRVFEIMRNDGYVPRHVTYSRALSAAVKASQHELVLEIFDDMLRNRIDPNIVTYNTILNSCARNGDAHTALGVLRAINQRGLEMTQSSYHSLAICGAKAGRWEIAHDAYNGLIASGFKPVMNMYNSVISAYAKGKQWQRIVEVYNEMPSEMRDLLQHTYLAATLMAFAKAEDPEVRRKTIEIFEHHKSRKSELNLFAHNAVLLYYLDTEQFDKLHALTQSMKKNKLEWDGLTMQYIILAHVRSGQIDKAEQLLHKHSKNMKFSTLCYREVIDYYGEVKKDPIGACRLSMQMMHLNPRLSRQDWITALTYALQAGNRSVYWNFRKWMKVRAAGVEIPEELLLAEEDEIKQK